MNKSILDLVEKYLSQIIVERSDVGKKHTDVEYPTYIELILLLSVIILTKINYKLY